MEVIRARNVCRAYPTGLKLLAELGEREESRGGPVHVVPSPVTTVYERPTERVLFDPLRDANPFFHLFESLWMLDGRNDASYLDQFVRDFSSRFAEPGTTRIHGAYGARWRGHWGMDQLETVVQRLHRDPRDRRVVLSMWDPIYDLAEPDDADPETGWATSWPEEHRDVPCNTQAYFRVRDVFEYDRGDPYKAQVLDMTVTCRSNDIVWGCYGANAVHFSVLQEYIAARLGVGIGRYYQVSNNWHGYDAVLRRVTEDGEIGRATFDPYTDGLVRPRPMVTHPREFLRDVHRFLEEPFDRVFGNPWFSEVAVPMLRAHMLHREGRKLDALIELDGVAAADWQLAARQWIDRRTQK